MRKQTKKIAFAVLFSMAMSFMAPAQMPAFAAKTFEYVEETTGESIKELALEVGEQVNLKPIGANSSTKWTSSNPRVAVVDSMGVITALSKGTATITMTLSGYTSEGVKVSVDDDREVAIGVTEEVFGYTMEKGTDVEFMYFGLLDGTEGRYDCNWTSTNPSVATVDSATGKVTAKKEGFTVLCLTLTNKTTSTKYEARPIAIEVVADGTGTVATATPMPTKPTSPIIQPTKKPTTTTKPTATPTPTELPEATATPVPTTAPVGEDIAYIATLVADNCIVVDFLNKKVDYDAIDVQLYKVVELSNNDSMKVRVSMESQLSSNGTKINVYPGDSDVFENDTQYIVQVNGEHNAKTINVHIGEPNRVEVSYECLGEEGKAYVYDEVMGLEVPVTLSYQVYYNTINVTETYKNQGYIEYEILSAQNPNDVDLSGDILNFYSKTYATLKATYFYSDENGDYKECKNTKPISIAAVKLPTYKIDGLVEWTVVDATESTAIDWEKPVKYTVAGAEDQKIVALIVDNYGRYYSTDERGVNEEKGIYFVENAEQIFSMMGYRTEFSFDIVNNNFIVESDGELITYETVKQGNAILEVINDSTDTVKEYPIYPIQVKDAKKLNGIQASTTSVALTTNTLPGYEENFAQAEIEILLKDQYGNEWTGDYDLELSSNVDDVDEALGGTTSSPAYLEGTTLYIDAENIMDVTNRTSVSFTVTETTTKRTTKVTVTLKKPKLSDINEVVVNSYQIGLKENVVKLMDTKAEDEIRAAQLEIYQLSSGVKVGLYDSSQIVIQESANHNFTVDNCAEGQVYVLVLGPDGKAVKEAESSDSVGVWIDSTEDCVMINVAGRDEDDSSMIEFLEKGKYTIKVTRITSVDKKVQKSTITPTSLSFTVEDNTSDVVFQSLRNRKTNITVSGKTDVESVKQIIVENFRFRLGNKEWTTLTTDMIKDVKFTPSKEYLVVHDIEFAVPYENEDSSMSYKKVIKGLNQAISFEK